MTLIPGDPLAHRALESLLRAESTVRRRLSSDLEREGISATGFSVLIVLATAGGEL
ncbi:MAG: MarR family transcriptional regulator, and catechol-resistance regulon repressor, partial [Solirubrobacteraceae bacterium]|nr:MarR family transcriptional regulator, and catechol-resistance regulon repressor [Solirubrobacteraceae bacterium]